MRAYVAPLAVVIAAVGAGAVDAASLTVTMNAIDANGIGKQVGRCACPTPRRACASHRSLPACRRATTVFTSTPIPIAVPARGRPAAVAYAPASTLPAGEGLEAVAQYRDTTNSVSAWLPCPASGGNSTPAALRNRLAADRTYGRLRWNRF